MDILRAALIVGPASTIVGLACAGYIAWENVNSRTVVFAVTAFAGAAVLLGLNLLFDLRSTESTDFISTELTVDRATPRIRQWWDYKNVPTQRFVREKAASDQYFAAHPGQFNGDREKLVRDMTIYSLLSYLVAEQRDWQSRPARFVGSMGSETVTLTVSKPEECADYTDDQLREVLADAKNEFAIVKPLIIGLPLCLPPHTVIEAKANALNLINPFCNISFVLEMSGGVFTYEPGNSLSQPLARQRARILGRQLPPFAFLLSPDVCNAALNL